LDTMNFDLWQLLNSRKQWHWANHPTTIHLFRGKLRGPSSAHANRNPRWSSAHPFQVSRQSSSLVGRTICELSNENPTKNPEYFGP
jgi:hypothetical protein